MNQFLKIQTQIRDFDNIIALIDLTALKSNYQKIAKIVGGTQKCSAVVKANAYGFGAIEVSKSLQIAGCREFFVATIEEGLQLRQSIDKSANIYVLSGIYPNTLDIFEENSLIPVISNRYQMNFIKKTTPIVMHFDTGISRNGFSPQEMIDNSTEFLSYNIKYMMSHLACADIEDHPLNSQQFELFQKITQNYPDIPRTFSNTNGVNIGEKYIFDLVRIGKGIYGFNCHNCSTSNVLSLYARIINICEVPPGTSVGYGATFTTEKTTKLATIHIGYADGLLRYMSNLGSFCINDKVANIVGKVSMDYTVLDVTHIENVEIGSWATIIGNDFTIANYANLIQTLPHEICARLGNRVRRIYINE